VCEYVSASTSDPEFARESMSESVCERQCVTESMSKREREYVSARVRKSV